MTDTDLRARYESGASLLALGLDEHQEPETVRRRIVAAGGTIRPRIGGKVVRVDLARLAKLDAEGLTAAVIAERLGVTAKSIQEARQRVRRA